MILICPNCATRYEADAAKFMPAGRKVRCAKCSHTWHQPAPELPASEIGETAAIETPAESVAAQPSVVSAEPRVAPIEHRIVESRNVVASGWRMGALAGWAALIAVVAIFAWAAIKYRQGIVTVWPQTATFYAAAGMDVNTVGLAFQDVSYRVTSEDDLPILHLKGKVVNITARELTIPQISASLTDEQRRDLYDWKIVVDAKSLAPGKTANFSAKLPSPPSGARHVDLKFVKG
ncbi:MAG TPA: MJ0042-type zinc finger domain-containing protein [Rhizomicrobium sp.]|jgi:predicted Zn finger-like uncharacterized protein